MIFRNLYGVVTRSENGSGRVVFPRVVNAWIHLSPFVNSGRNQLPSYYQSRRFTLRAEQEVNRVIVYSGGVTERDTHVIINRRDRFTVAVHNFEDGPLFPNLLKPVPMCRNFSEIQKMTDAYSGYPATKLFKADLACVSSGHKIVVAMLEESLLTPTKGVGRWFATFQIID